MHFLDKTFFLLFIDFYFYFDEHWFLLKARFLV